MPELPFGRLMTAMVTPFGVDGALDVEGVSKLAAFLVDDMANDALVVNGTTGEAPTTSDEEKLTVVAESKKAVGDRAQIIAGVGTFSTAHSIELARQAADAGADGLLVVTPYYSRPPQDALIEHFTAIADATDLPVILYDIPKRTGTPIEEQTLIQLAAHPRIVGVKDAKGDVTSSARVMAATDLVYYSGDDAITLPLMAVGGVGLVGTSTHLTGRRAKEFITAYADGRHAEALDIYRAMLPIMTGVFAMQGCVLVKAGLRHLGVDVGGVRPPLLDANREQAAAFTALLDAADL